MTLQKIAFLQQRISLFKKKSPFFTLFFLCTFAPSLVITLFSLFFLEGTQKSQLVLVAFATLLFCISALKLLLGGLLTTTEKETLSKVQEECKQQENTAEELHKEEIRRYQEKIKEYENSFIEMQGAYDQKIAQQQSSLDHSREEIEELHGQMSKKIEDVRQAYFEFEDVRKEMTRLEEELKYSRIESDEKILRKETLISDYQHTIYEQRRVLEKKQDYIGKLENKVRDLMYEIRTLLQLEEAPSDPNIDVHTHDEKSVAEYYLPTNSTKQLNTFDITMQLERILEQAEGFMGADHLGYRGGNGPRFADLSRNSYQIDLRRFFDTLKDENSILIFFFSLQEGRFLFVNNFVKTLLGHSPEKFMYKFTEIVDSGYQQWLEALGRLAEKSSERVRLMMHTREGKKLLLSCQMGMVSGGPFRGHVIGILAPSDVA